MSFKLKRIRNILANYLGLITSPLWILFLFAYAFFTDKEFREIFKGKECFFIDEWRL